MWKKSNGCKDIVSLIQCKFPQQCGIVYCLERKDTVDVAYHLKAAGINAIFFHAGMDIHEKQTAVESWKSGRSHVICATVAFGMGIDKPNVRFVIHHSFPKDLESYVQEAGRGGRDGNVAHCYIFFRFEDRSKHLRNVSSLPDSDRKIVSLAGLNDMVKYCITPTCRRQQLVTYFDKDDTSGELCNKSCDICASGESGFTNTDCTEYARDVMKCLEGMQKIQPKVTTKFLALTFCGSRSSIVLAKGFQNVVGYGDGKNIFSEKMMKKFLQCLITERILDEQLRSGNDNCTTPYICKGPNACKLENGKSYFYFYK